MLRFGLPYTASMLVGTGVVLVMPVLVLHVVGSASVGYYRAAATIGIAYLGFLLRHGPGLFSSRIRRS